MVSFEVQTKAALPYQVELLPEQSRMALTLITEGVGILDGRASELEYWEGWVDEAVGHLALGVEGQRDFTLSLGSISVISTVAKETLKRTGHYLHEDAVVILQSLLYALAKAHSASCASE